MNKEKLKRFVDLINDLIEQNGEDASITLGNLRDIFQEQILCKELKEAQKCFFVTQSDIDLAEARLSNNRLQKWLQTHYVISGALIDQKEFEKHSTKVPVQFAEGFSGIY